MEGVSARRRRGYRCRGSGKTQLGLHGLGADTVVLSLPGHRGWDPGGNPTVRPGVNAVVDPLLGLGHILAIEKIKLSWNWRSRDVESSSGVGSYCLNVVR